MLFDAKKKRQSPAQKYSSKVEEGCLQFSRNFSAKLSSQLDAMLHDCSPPRPPLPHVSGTADPGVVKQDKSSRGSVDTTETRSDTQRVRMSSGERPIGTAKGKQLIPRPCANPPPPPTLSSATFPPPLRAPLVVSSYSPIGWGALMATRLSVRRNSRGSTVTLSR